MIVSGPLIAVREGEEMGMGTREGERDGERKHRNEVATEKGTAAGQGVIEWAALAESPDGLLLNSTRRQLQPCR